LLYWTEKEWFLPCEDGKVGVIGDRDSFVPCES
jgi:hypothetical protein